MEHYFDAMRAISLSEGNGEKPENSSISMTEEKSDFVNESYDRYMALTMVFLVSFFLVRKLSQIHLKDSRNTIILKYK